MSQKVGRFDDTPCLLVRLEIEMIIGIILGVLIASAFWIWMIVIMLKRSKTKTENWSANANALLERKCDTLDELCEIIRLKGE